MNLNLWSDQVSWRVREVESVFVCRMVSFSSNVNSALSSGCECKGDIGNSEGTGKGVGKADELVVRMMVFVICTVVCG